MRVYISRPTEDDKAAFTEAMRRSRKLHGRWVSMPETPHGGDIVGFLILASSGGAVGFGRGVAPA